MKRPYVRDPLTGGSGTLAFTQGFLEAFTGPTENRSSICDTLFGAMPVPMEVLYASKSSNALKRYIGRAAPVMNGSNSDEALWCEVADVSKACAGLTPDQRKVIFFKYIRDLGDHEIAQQLGVPLSTVLDLVSSSIACIASALDGQRVVD